jgi:hypothetical protein
MTVEAKPATRKREPALVPVGYSVPAIKRRFTRPLHRHAVLEAAEAAFKPKARVSDEMHDIKPRLSRWPQISTTARMVPTQLDEDVDA